MTTQGDKERWRRATFRDTGLTVLLGPLRFVAPIVAYLFLYPLILSRSGAEVLGIWSLVGAVQSLIAFGDVGFSTLLAREAGRDRFDHDLQEIHADYLAAHRAYWVLLAFLLLVFSLLQRPLLAPLEAIYSLSALRASVTLLILGTTIQLLGKLDAAILSARHDNYFVQLVGIVAPIFMFSSAIIGAWIMRPIEGLAVGSLLSGLVMISAYRWRLSRQHGKWRSAGVSLPLRETPQQIWSLARRGWHLYTISVGMLLREPLFRFVVAFGLGLEAVAVYDIAMRVTRSARDVIASGFNVLYPSFAYFHRAGDRFHTIELAHVSLLVLLSLGAAALGVLIGVADSLYSLWLHETPEGLVTATQILAVWNLITIVNVPFWFLLQATHNERAAALSLWAHTACILLVVPAYQAVQFSLPSLLVYWTATALLTQALIYSHVQTKLSLLWAIVLKPRVVTMLGASLAFVVVAFLSAASGRLATTEPLDYLGTGLAIFVLASAFILWRPLQGLLALTRSH